MALPSHGALFWNGYWRAIPVSLENGSANFDILCPGGYLALLGSSCLTLGPILQAYPQNPPSILSSIWHCSRVRVTYRNHSTRLGYSWSTYLVHCYYQRFSYSDDVYVDHSSPLPSYRCAQWL